jgi:hypothetical protein
MAAVRAALPWFYGGIDAVGNLAMKALDLTMKVPDWIGWFIHGRQEYMTAGRPISTNGVGSQPVVSQEGPVVSYQPLTILRPEVNVVKTQTADGSPLYLNATAGMTEKQFLRVLDLQGTSYTRNEDGTLTITKLGEEPGFFTTAGGSTRPVLPPRRWMPGTPS